LRRWPIRWRLLLAYLGIILLGFGALTLLAAQQLASAVRFDYEETLIKQVELVAQGLSPSIIAYCQGDLSEDELEARLAPYQAQTGGQLQLYFTGFEPIRQGNSRTCTENLDVETAPPDLARAIDGSPGVVERPNEVGESTFYTAASILDEGRPSGLLQLAVPSESLNRLLWERWLALAVGVILLSSLSGLAAIGLAQSITRPLQELQHSAGRLAAGDLAHRVPLVGQDEIRYVGEAFNRMAMQVQQMLDEQRAFVSNTSHELRTPLTTIQLRAEMAAHHPNLPPAQVQQYLLEIESEAARLGNLVQSLLLLSRLDAGRLEIGHDQIEIGRFAVTLRQQLLPQLEKKEISLVLTLPEETTQVMINLNHLNVIFRNLLENAIKYTPPGGQIDWQMRPNERGLLHLIQDTGQGLTPEQLTRVFERFYRADKARSRDIPGTGLGLSLVKSIVEAYGGEISLASEGLGQGVLVKLVLPYQHPAP
jgi:signal transduction histidine kinase